MATVSISSYKLDLLKDVFNNSKIVQGIDSQQKSYDPDSPDSLIYSNLWPYHKVKNLQTVADSHIMLEVDVLDINKYNPTYAKYRIKLRILVHEDRMRMKGFNGTRLDYLYEELKEQFDGQQKYGFSELELHTRIADVYNENYHFADMILYTNDLRKPVTKSGR